tara:strand:- start:95 stop:259 length:165 start_codon:yes stop_codon:yes gene_type:complete
MATIIRKHNRVKGVYYVNGKSLFLDNLESYKTSNEFTSVEMKAFNNYLASIKII